MYYIWMFTFYQATLWSCNVKGCSGKGNSNSSKPNHISVKDCPYELETWKKISNGSVKLLDRLTPDNVPKPSMAATTKYVYNFILKYFALFFLILII